MSHPLLSLLVVALAIGMSGLLLWPVSGLFWRLRRQMQATGRVLLEDALKHIFDCEYQRRGATLHSLAGALGISAHRAAALLDRLGAQGLVVGGEGLWRLTEAGRGYALRVLRVHRLWEQYLSDRTGLRAEEWHPEADWREHRTTLDEAEAMAEAMGHPAFDPHGDPIPTASGEMPPSRGRALTDLKVGESAEIVHVEDEPASVFAQIAAAGLRPGSIVRLVEKTERRVRIESAEDEQVLAPVVAANVTVSPAPAPAVERVRGEPLTNLSCGVSGRVVALSAGCRGLQRRRLLDLGLVPGTVVEPVLQAAAGGPTAYRIRGTLIALRREQAGWIEVERVTAGGRT